MLARASRGFFDSLFLFPAVQGLPRTDGTSLTAPRAFTAMHSARYTAPASHRRPPAFIGPRRAMDSCGVGAFSLNYGPQTTRGKSPYASDPCLRAPSPRHANPTPSNLTTLLSDFRAARFPHFQVSVVCKRISLRYSCTAISTSRHIRSCVADTAYSCVLPRRARFASLFVRATHRCGSVSLSCKTRKYTASSQKFFLPREFLLLRALVWRR
jgi:hypothetical protein